MAENPHITSEHISFRLDKETAKLFDIMIAKSGKSRSEILRDIVYRWLKGDKYTDDNQRVYEVTKAALKEVLTPAVNRIAAIGAKNAQMAGSEYFMLVYLLKYIMGSEKWGEVDELCEQARLSGIETLKATDGRVDTVIKKSIKETEDFL